MISGCNYQKIESLLPPLVPTDVQNSPGIANHDFPRLYHISACAIMRDEDIARCLLPDTPAMFFKPLLQAAILNNFYKKDQRLKLVPGSLVQLILHWPHETFVLKEVLPSLPPPNFNRLSQFNSLDLIDTELQKFYAEIIYLLPLEFIRSRSTMASIDEWKLSPSCQKQTSKPFNSPVKKIDVSGYLTCNFLSTECNHLHELMASVEAAYNPNCPLVNDKDHKLELICDVLIDASKEEDLNALGIITEINSHHGAKLTVIFRKVVILSNHLLPLDNNQILSLLNMLYKNGTEFIELMMNEVGNEISTSFSPQLQGLCLSETKITSLEFLNNMSNLQQLNLSMIWLRNNLAPLCCLPRGLKFLMLVGCGLTGDDMKILEQSHHTQTLLHLDIGDNDFAFPVGAAGLIGFCQVLVSVQILRIECCGLNELPPDILGLLVQSLATLPKLSLLYLSHNDFTSSLLYTHIKVLHTCISLRCVCLTVPSDIYLINDFNIIQNHIKELQSKIDSDINCSRETVLNVIWEDWNYTEWLNSGQP